MQKMKLYILLCLLTFSLNLSPTSVGNKISVDVVNDTEFTTRPISYSFEDTDSNFLFDWLNLIIELDVNNLSYYQFDINVYDNLSGENLFYNYFSFETTDYGLQNVTVPIEGYYLYETDLVGDIRFELRLYDNEAGIEVGSKQVIIWVNYSDFELPPVSVDWSTLTVTYYDIETDTNQTTPSGAVDLIFVDFIYQQRITGYFDVYGDYSVNFVYTSSNNYVDDVEAPPGTYNKRLIFDTEELSDLGTITLEFYIYGYLLYDSFENYYDAPNYNFERTTTGNMFEPPLYTIDFYDLNFVDTDANGLINAFGILLTVDARKSFELDLGIYMTFNDDMGHFYSEESVTVTVNVGTQLLTVYLDATYLYGESADNYYDLHYHSYIENYWGDFTLRKYDYWFDLPIIHQNYDQPNLYIESASFTPDYNDGSTISPDSLGYDFLMLNITISSKISGYLSIMIAISSFDLYDYYYYTELYSDITQGTFTYTFYLNGSLFANILEGNITLLVYSEVYDEIGENDIYDFHGFYGVYGFNPDDFNPLGYYIEPILTPTDTTTTDPPSDTTTSDPVDTTPTSTTETSSIGETTSTTDASVEEPTLDLPAPPLYLSLLSIFAVFVLLKKKR